MPPPVPPSVAVLVPTLDEEHNLRRHLPALLAAADEVVVSDGGSRDRSREVARALGARVVEGPAGRGGQLNRAAAAASSEVLLFLHADTILPAEGVNEVRRAAAAGARGGGFLIRFDGQGWVYRLGETVVNLRTRLVKTPLGDQAQFATRDTFQALGGFRDWPILEDLDFVRRLKRCGPVTVVPLQVATSVRRFEAGGPLRTVLRNWLIWTLFLLGVPARRLARLYRTIR